MAPPAGTLRVGRYFLALLAIFAVLYMIVFWPGQRHTPKLGLDLEGGVQVVFKAIPPPGGKITKSAMSEAQQIMEDRVNGSGVSNATVIVQGSDLLSVSIPGKSSKDIQDLGSAAQLNFRPLVMPAAAFAGAAAPTPTPTPSSSGSGASTASPTGSTAPNATSNPSASATHSANVEHARPLAAPTTSAAPKPSATTPAPVATTPAAAASSAADTATCAGAKTGAKPSIDPLAGCNFKVPTSDTAFDALTPAQQAELGTAVATFDCTSSAPRPDVKDQAYLACDKNRQYVYLLGTVIVPGTEISSADAQAPDTNSFQWGVSVSLKSSGAGAWAKYTTAHNVSGLGSSVSPDPTSCSASTVPCADFVGFTLDGQVISIPVNNEPINGQATLITGSFTQSTANSLAKQLKYGALPLSFTPEQTQDVSATLGSAQLKAGLLAGGIGLILVVLYSLIYYRGLGLVTIASLLVSGGLTYACLVILGKQIGFTLTLAGIAGFIVAVGITADSFVVFFERLKDEVHEGRSFRVAVPRAWVRARRTILSADTVSFLAAAVLYYFAAGDVKGFAFTLGLSTILDLVVVFLFTHPIVSLLARSRAFGSARFTGLNSLRSGAILADEAPVARPARTARSKPAPAAPAAARPAPVVMLDKDDDEEPAPPVEPEPEPPAGIESPPRESSGPKGGTAAERAAARRARLRSEAAEKRGDR